MVQSISVNFWALLVSAVINLVLGMLWFGPLFGKIWARGAGVSMDPAQGQKKGMATRTIIGFIAAIVMFFVLQHAIVYAGAQTAAAGVFVAFWNWLGLIAVPMLGLVLWERRPMSYFFVQVGFYLVLFIITGAMLAVWV